MDWVISVVTGLMFAVVLAPLAMLLLTLFVLVPLAHLLPAPSSPSRATFTCPVTKRTVNAAFLVTPSGGTPADVVECSRFGKGPIACGKICLGEATSGWAPSPMVPRYSLVSNGEAFR